MVTNWVLFVQYVQFRAGKNKNYQGMRPSRREESKASRKKLKKDQAQSELSDGRQQREQYSSSNATSDLAMLVG